MISHLLTGARPGLLGVSPTATLLTAVALAFVACARALSLERRLPEAAGLTPRPTAPGSAVAERAE